MLNLNRKVKYGAGVGGSVGVIIAAIMSWLHVHLSPEELAFIPVALSWLSHVVTSYFTREKPGSNG